MGARAGRGRLRVLRKRGGALTTDSTPTGRSGARPTFSHGVRIYGRPVDDETRCVHYHGPNDIVAIRFACCGHYYPCICCHREAADHEVVRWPAGGLDERAVRCGRCGSELSVREYVAVTGCPSCGSSFNPGCRDHYGHYFDLSGLDGEDRVCGIGG